MPQSQKRNRKVAILTQSGLQKLQIAISQSNCWDHYSKSATLEALSERTGLSTHTLSKVHARQASVDLRTLVRYFNAFNLTLETDDYISPKQANDTLKPVLSLPPPALVSTSSTHTYFQPDSSNSTPEIASDARADWGEAPDVSLFYGGNQELEELTQWISADRCKLVALLGLGGIGKTALVTKLAQQLASEFEFIIWRSLRNASTLEALLSDLVPFLSNQRRSEPTLITLLRCLRQSRCLIILDNLETLLEAEEIGQFQASFEDYDDLLRLIAEAGHQSCVMLTSREKPNIVATLEGVKSTVRSLRLEGFPKAAQAILQDKGLVGTIEQKQQLGDHYSHNPLALKIVATSIQTVFDSNISEFLNADTLIFNGIRRLFDQQFQRLSELEKSLMYWLAINREWTSLAELQNDIFPTVSKGKLLESLKALSFRYLIERRGTQFTQQPVVMEYVTEQILDRAAADLQQPTLNFLTTHTLLKATAKDYIRETQRRLIVESLCDRLLHQFQNQTVIVEQIQNHLIQLRRSTNQGYGADNLINLLCHLKADLTEADLYFGQYQS